MQSNSKTELSGCCSHGDRCVTEIFLTLQKLLALLRTSRQKNFSSSVYSHPDARRVQKKKKKTVSLALRTVSLGDDLSHIALFEDVGCQWQAARIIF